MVFAMGLAYALLLCPVTVCFAAGITGSSGSVMMEISYLGLCLRYDGVLRWKSGRPELAARCGQESTRKRQARRKTGRGRETLNRVRRYIGLLNLTGCAGEITLDLRIGTGDAAQTALAAGACSAVLPELLAGFARQARHCIRISPEYAKPCLNASLRGIFFAPAGDIMIAAAKAALQGKRGHRNRAQRNAPKKNEKRKREQRGKASH